MAAPSFASPVNTMPMLGGVALDHAARMQCQPIPRCGPQVPQSVPNYCPMISDWSRNAQLATNPPHWIPQVQVPVTQPEQVRHFAVSCEVNPQAMPGEAAESNSKSDSSTKKPRKGIRNRVMKKTDQGLEIVDSDVHCDPDCVPAVEDQPDPLSTREMLKWFSVVLSEGLSENAGVCHAVCAENPKLSSQIWQDSSSSQSSQWSPNRCSVQRSWWWQEEEALVQRKTKNGKNGKKTSKENQSNNHWPPHPALEESANSWSAQQKQRTRSLSSDAKSDEEIVRTMKAILNKLTIQKYDNLYQQIQNCGMSTVEHVISLIDEVLDKAESQHHFIPMYCQLCMDLHEWFIEHEVADTPEYSFRRILLHQCQNKFEDNLLPAEFSTLKEDDVEEAMIKHKHAVLGNIKFIGALLERRMLGDALLIAIAQQLYEASTPHTLESLACFLTTVGATFDQPTFQYYGDLQAIFVQIEEKSKDRSIMARTRFLLHDLLDLRKANWKKAAS